MSHAARVSFAPLASNWTRLVALWKKLPVMCSLCGRPNDGDSIEHGETVAWCAHCQHVFEVPALRIPGWITGVLAVLLINLH